MFEVLRPSDWDIYRKRNVAGVLQRFDHWSRGMPMKWKIFESFQKGEMRRVKNGKYFRWMSPVKRWFYSVAKLHCSSEISYYSSFSSIFELWIWFLQKLSIFFSPINQWLDHNLHAKCKVQLPYQVNLT